MMMMRRSTLIAAALAASLLLPGCSKDGEEEQETKPAAMPELLRYVPADTPYVMVSGKPFPRELTEKLLKNGNADLDRMIDNFRLMSRDEPNPVGVPSAAGADADVSVNLDIDREKGVEVDVDVAVERRLETLVDAILSEFQGKMSAEGLESLGFTLSGRSVVYGLGILPVMRIQVKDPTRVEALLGRIENRSGLKAEQRTLDGLSYRWFDLDELVGVMGLKEDFLIMALLPANAEAQMLPLVLGDALPRQSLAQTDKFRQLYQEYGFSGFGDGYVDLVRVAGFLLGEGDQESQAVRKALEIDTSDLSLACEDLLKSQVRHWPRLVVGFPEVKTDGYRMRMVMETSPGVAARIEKLAAPVPGLGEDTDALLSIGLGSNLAEYREAIKAGMQSLIEHGKECEWIDETALTQGMQSMDMMLNPMFSGIRGIYLKLNDVQIDRATMMPASVDAKLLLAVEDPKGIFGMLGMLNHKFTQMQIPDDGTPVQLPMDEMAPGAPPGYVAIKGKILGFSVGVDGDRDLPDFMDGKLASPSPMLAASYNVALLAQRLQPLIDDARQSVAAKDDPAKQAILDALEPMRSSGEVYGQVSLKIMGSDRGLVLDQVVNLR